MAKVKKLPSGNYNIKIYDGKDADGKRIYKSFTATTKEEAKYLASSYQVGNKESRQTSSLTLKQAYVRYIESKSNVLSPASVREYNRLKDTSLKDIMLIKLKNLTQERIQVAINLEAASHSPKSVRDIHGLLSAVLTMYLPNFKLTTRLPQKIKPDVYVPTEDEIMKLLQAAKGRDIELAILLAAVGTLRRSEISALAKEDVFENGVSVNKAMVRTTDKEWVIKSTKSTAGKRFVELPQEITAKLCGREGTVVPLRPGTITNQFNLLCQKALGKTFRFHDLRHYSASVLHALNIPDAYIMQRGGWGSRDTLQRVYTHVLSEEQKQHNATITDHFKSGILLEMQHEKQHE